MIQLYNILETPTSLCLEPVYKAIECSYSIFFFLFIPVQEQVSCQVLVQKYNNLCQLVQENWQD